MPDHELYRGRIKKGLCGYCGKKPLVKGLHGCRKCIDKQNNRRREKRKKIVDPKLELIKLFGKTKIIEKIEK